MKKNIMRNCFLFFTMMVIISQSTIGVSENQENEFVVKKKSKKENAAAIKEDIGLELELSLRQMSKNIAEQARVQQQIFDKIKDLVGACDSDKSVFCGTAEQLKAQRHKLKIFSEKLARQHDDLQTFVACF